MATTAAEKSFQLQMQMRQNTEEMSSFLKDMSEWTKEVAKKDETLLKSNKSEPALPPVRNQTNKKKKKKKKKEVNFKELEQLEKEGKDTGEKGKIKGYDYRAWDKFDVDAALKEMDGEEKKKDNVEEEGEGEEEEEEYEEEEEDPEEQEERLAKQKKMHASYYKERGNDCFKEGKWEEAVEYYTLGLGSDALNAILFANRAMALLKLQRYAAAIEDCDCSIELDDQYTKAYLRRATAHQQLDNKTQALADFKKVLELEPENKMAQSSVKKLEASVEPAVEYKPVKPGDITNMKRTLPPSDKPMIRIQIYDVTPDDYDMTPTKKGESEVKSEENGASAAPVEQVEKKPPPVQYNTLPTRIPMNYLQFQTDIRKLKDHPEALFEYIKKIDPDVYPKLFQESLEADQLFMILDVLNKFYIPNNLPVYNELYYLTKVKRFNMAVMFKTERQQLCVGQLVEYAARTVDDKLGIINLIKSYNIMDLSKYNLKNIV